MLRKQANSDVVKNQKKREQDLARKTIKVDVRKPITMKKAVRGEDRKLLDLEYVTRKATQQGQYWKKIDEKIENTLTVCVYILLYMLTYY